MALRPSKLLLFMAPLSATGPPSVYEHCNRPSHFLQDWPGILAGPANPITLKCASGMHAGYGGGGGRGFGQQQQQAPQQQQYQQQGGYGRGGAGMYGQQQNAGGYGPGGF